jgi:hypothetical protein
VLRRTIAVFAMAALLGLGLLAPLSTARVTTAAVSNPCGDEEPTPAARAGDPVACAQSDIPPPGVVVTKSVSTAVLETRAGAAEMASQGAEDTGVPTPATYAEAGNNVACDGDGVAGYRTQAIYVVTSDKVNRFAAVKDNIKTWAAGVDTVFNRSAAKTGGVRNVRFVTEPNGDGTCSATVLNVTLAPGQTATFSSTITAMVNAGFSNPARKYLMWVDGTGYCGIAQLYPDSRADQGNPNNGSYVQFARIDPACWGYGQSVEAHELAHTLGSVQNDAPHSSHAGHCWDESDRMCYADGGSAGQMHQVCPGDQEELLDCNDDDYFTTFESSGTYLATHWNTANSRFLIGGGNGSGGGTVGAPTRLGGTLVVNNPGIPGLPTQVQFTPELPAGRTAATVWTTTRADCLFGDSTAAATTLTCNANLTTVAPVVATVTDSTGERIVRTSTVTFDKTARTATAQMAVDGSSAGTYLSCPSGKAILSARAVDAATGAGIKGVPVSWYRTVGTAAAVKVAGATTDATGTATSLPVVATVGTYQATTTASLSFPAQSSAGIAVTSSPTPCPTALSADASSTSVMAGAPMTVSGVLHRTVGAVTPGAVGESVTVKWRAWVRPHGRP